jgi:drug/metabolite transporter (DMT)-like permease
MGIAAISCAAIFVRLALGEGVPSLSIAAWRLILASIILLPYAWATRRAEIRDLTRREVVLVIASGIFLGLHFAAWIASLGLTSVASSVVLVSMGPVFVGLGSWLFLRERLQRAMALGIIMAAMGSIVISWRDLGQGQDQLLGDLLALLGAVMIGGYLMIGRKVRAKRSLVIYIALVYAVAMLTMLLIVAVAQVPMFGFGPAAYFWILALGLISQLIGHSTLNWALRHLSATYVSIVTLAEPIGAGILAYLIFGESVTLATFVGAALVLGGILIASRAELAAPTPGAEAQGGP